MVSAAAKRHTRGMKRRDILGLVHSHAIAGALTAWLGSCALPGASVAPQPVSPNRPRRRLRAMAFDLFTIFDPRTVIAAAEAAVPGDGPGLVEAWRARQFQYSWLRALGDRYADFRHITEDALVYAARARGHVLSADARQRLVRANEQLDLWPESRATLLALRADGLRLATLANFTLDMQHALLSRVGISGLFEHLLSTDQVRAFKPAPRAYQLAVDAFGLAPEEIAFSAFGPWDAVGATWFGYPTFWVNRLKLPSEELAATPEGSGETLADLRAWALER